MSILYERYISLYPGLILILFGSSPGTDKESNKRYIPSVVREKETY